ncbi:MAG: lactonase family protein [Chitinophagaceae bacterium]
MKRRNKLFAMAMGLLVFTACQKDDGSENDDRDDSGPGHLYTISNNAKGNTLIDYRRSSKGILKYDSSYSTGGNGTGSGLGSQGAVILVDDEIVLAVNAGSNTISSFKVTNRGLVLKATISSGGVKPVSITEHNHIVFVLNGGGTDNISGFKLSNDGSLYPIPNSTKPLSAVGVGPAQVSFVNNGRVLAITEKASNKIITYNESGTMHMITSSNKTPFGFAVGKNGKIFVSEAAGGAAGASTLSSYQIENNGAITLVKGPVGANQSAACWVVLTNNGKFAFATNTASNNVSTFNVNSSSGTISVKDPISAVTGKGPIDACVSNNSKYFYVLNPGSNSIDAFTVGNDGSLSTLQTVTGFSGPGAGMAVK